MVIRVSSWDVEADVTLDILNEQRGPSYFKTVGPIVPVVIRIMIRLSIAVPWHCSLPKVGTVLPKSWLANVWMNQQDSSRKTCYARFPHPFLVRKSLIYLKFTNFQYRFYFQCLWMSPNSKEGTDWNCIIARFPEAFCVLRDSEPSQYIIGN